MSKNGAEKFSRTTFPIKLRDGEVGGEKRRKSQIRQHRDTEQAAMNKWITVTFFTILACHWGNALECYTCGYGLCSLPSKTTCGLLEVCLTETIQTGSAYLKKKSCSSPTSCLQGSETTYAGIKVTTTPSCCATDLCSSSASIPSASILTVIAIFISLWVAKL